jgi:hypothetical protein
MVDMVDIGVLLLIEVLGVSSWGGVYYMRVTISSQGGLRCGSEPVEKMCGENYYGFFYCVLSMEEWSLSVLTCPCVVVVSVHTYIYIYIYIY